MSPLEEVKEFRKFQPEDLERFKSINMVKPNDVMRIFGLIPSLNLASVLGFGYCLSKYSSLCQFSV